MFSRASFWLKSKVGQWRAALIGPHVTALVIEANGCKIVAPPDDIGVVRKLAYSGSYDADYLAFYKRQITPDSRVLIVGTHVGAILLPLANLCKEVVGVEANPRTFGYLQAGVAMNQLTNVVLHEKAASDRSETLSFLASRSNSGGAKIAPIHERAEFTYDHPETIQVQGVRLDDLIADRAFDLIIMDIEGAEFKALGGMPDILARSKTLVCELVPNHLEHVAGVTFAELAARIPPRYGRFSLTSDRSVDCGRRGLPDLYRQVQRQHPFGGSDLICYSA